MQKINTYKGYSLFNDVEEPALRTWNRCVVMLNINKDHGEDFVKGYAGCMGDVERIQMMTMYQYIAVKGTDAVRLEINQGKHSQLDHGAGCGDKVVH